MFKKCAVSILNNQVREAVAKHAGIKQKQEQSLGTCSRAEQNIYESVMKARGFILFTDDESNSTDLTVLEIHFAEMRMIL